MMAESLDWQARAEALERERNALVSCLSDCAANALEIVNGANALEMAKGILTLTSGGAMLREDELQALQCLLDDANAHAKRMHEFGLREEILREEAERERDEARTKLQSCRLLKNEALMKCSDLRRELAERKGDGDE